MVGLGSYGRLSGGRREVTGTMLPDGFATPRLILRPIRQSDAQAIFDGYGQDAEVTRYLT